VGCYLTIAASTSQAITSHARHTDTSLAESALQELLACFDIRKRMYHHIINTFKSHAMPRSASNILHRLQAIGVQAPIHESMIWTEYEQSSQDLFLV
jgi:hypothetical protein